MRLSLKAPLHSLVLLAVAFFAIAPAAHAATIRWHLNDFVFNDGATATGFFDWDTTAGTSTNYAITLAGGNTAAFPVTTYTDESTDFLHSAVPATLYFFEDPRVFRIGLATLASLATPTEVLALVGSAQSGGAGFVECFNCTPARLGLVSTNAHLSAVPEPMVTTTCLVGIGLATYRRRRSRR